MRLEDIDALVQYGLTCQIKMAMRNNPAIELAIKLLLEEIEKLQPVIKECNTHGTYDYEMDN